MGHALRQGAQALGISPGRLNLRVRERRYFDDDYHAHLGKMIRKSRPKWI